MPENCIVRIVDFQRDVGGVNGMVLLDESGFYNIYLNARASWFQQRKALRHELNHIENDDFFNGKPIDEVEDI